MLSIDQADLEAIQPTLMIDNQREISLIRWFDRATYVTEGFTHVRRPDNSITGGSLDSIFAQPPYGDKARLLEHDDNRLAWDGFQIPQQATFITQLGISYWARDSDTPRVGLIFAFVETTDGSRSPRRSRQLAACRWRAC